MYKVGELVTTQCNAGSPGYQPGQYVDVVDRLTKERVAKLVVLERNGIEVKGKVITTYGHKRRTGAK